MAPIVAIVVIGFLVDRRNRRTFNDDLSYRPEHRMSVENHPAHGAGDGGGGGFGDTSGG